MWYSFYLRAKRQKRTLFVACSPSDPLATVIARIATLEKKAPEDVRLYAFREEENVAGAPFDDPSLTLEQLQLANDQAVAYVFRTGKSLGCVAATASHLRRVSLPSSGRRQRLWSPRGWSIFKIR